MYVQCTCIRGFGTRNISKDFLLGHTLAGITKNLNHSSCEKSRLNVLLLRV